MSYCCFIGTELLSAEREEKIRPKLERAILDLPLESICGFMYARGAGFELLAFEIILKLKKSYPLIDIMLIPQIPIYEYNEKCNEYKSRTKRIEDNANAFIDTVRNSENLYARLTGMIESCDNCVVLYRNNYFCNFLVKHANESKKNIIYFK